MDVDTYKSTKNGNKYISVPAGTDIENMEFPEGLDPDLLTLSPFKSSLTLDPSTQRIAMDQQDVMKQINEKGYAVHHATAQLTIGQGR